jgi:hypothetical protein
VYGVGSNGIALIGHFKEKGMRGGGRGGGTDLAAFHVAFGLLSGSANAAVRFWAQQGLTGLLERKMAKYMIYLGTGSHIVIYLGTGAPVSKG